MRQCPWAPHPRRRCSSRGPPRGLLVGLAAHIPLAACRTRHSWTRSTPRSGRTSNTRLGCCSLRWGMPRGTAKRSRDWSPPRKSPPRPRSGRPPPTRPPPGVGAPGSSRCPCSARSWRRCCSAREVGVVAAALGPWIGGRCLRPACLLVHGPLASCARGVATPRPQASCGRTCCPWLPHGKSLKTRRSVPRSTLGPRCGSRRAACAGRRQGLPPARTAPAGALCAPRIVRTSVMQFPFAAAQVLAQHIRGGLVPTHEQLYATASAIQAKLDAKRAAAEAARLQARGRVHACVFEEGGVSSSGLRGGVCVRVGRRGGGGCGRV